MTTPPPQPPVMKLIEDRRARLDFSLGDAAAMAGMSASRWSQLEAGSRPGADKPEPASDRTLARMASVVDVSARELREAGHPEAAALLDEHAAEWEAARAAVIAERAAQAAVKKIIKLRPGTTARQRAALTARITEAAQPDDD